MQKATNIKTKAKPNTDPLKDAMEIGYEIGYTRARILVERSPHVRANLEKQIVFNTKKFEDLQKSQLSKSQAA